MTWLRKFANFVPAGEQLDTISVAFERVLKIGDVLLKATVIGSAFYFAFEIGLGLIHHFGAH